MGYDYYSFYVAVRKLGCIKSAVIGRYKVRFGQGLVVIAILVLEKQCIFSHKDVLLLIFVHTVHVRKQTICKVEP